MFLLTGEALVISLLIIASRAWPTSRSKNNSSYGWISSGDVSHLQASGVIPRNTSTDIPSPRSFDGGATDQTILANTRQFNTNYMTSRQQERQSNMGSQMNPYQSNINKSPHATERNKQGYDHEIHSTTNEHRINLHQLSREVMISLQHQQHSEGNQNCNQYSGKNCSQIFMKANQSRVSERLNNDRRNSNIVHTTEQYMAVGVHENKKPLKQSMLTSQESLPGDNSRKINKQQLSRTNLEELLAHGVISAGQDDFHNDENYVHRAVSIPIDHKVQRGSIQNNFNLGALPLLHNNSFNQHIPPRQNNLEFSITMPQTVYRDNQNRSLPDSVSNNKPLQVATSLASPRNEESKLFISEESVMFNPDSETQSQRSFRHPNITSSAQGRIVSPMSFRIQPYKKVYNETQDPDASGSKIVFPGEMSGNTVIKFKPQVNGPRPPCADGSSFCETTDEYPHDYVRNLLKNEASIGIGFTDFLPIPVGTRIQPDEQHYLCASSEHVVYPKMAQNKDQKWLFVLNEDSYLQGVRIEKCEKQGPCSFSDNFPLGFVTTCQQKYIYRKLLALGEDGKPTSDSFRLPSCCSCLVTRPVPSPRMSGVGKDQTPATSRKRRR